MTNVHIQPPIYTDRALELSWKDSNIRYLDHLGNSDIALFLMHVPPFQAACWHQGQVSGDEWLPWFACDAVGRVVSEIAATNPRCSITVLCGHTHGSGCAQISPNVTVFTMGSFYGAPDYMELDLDEPNFGLLERAWVDTVV